MRSMPKRGATFEQLRPVPGQAAVLGGRRHLVAGSVGVPQHTTARSAESFPGVDSSILVALDSSLSDDLPATCEAVSLDFLCRPRAIQRCSVAWDATRSRA